MSIKVGTYQSDKYANELDDVCVGDRVQATEEGVSNGDEGRYHHGEVHVDAKDDCEGGSKGGQDGGRPEGFSQQGWDVEDTAHYFAVFVLQRVDHGHVACLSHRFGE